MDSASDIDQDGNSANQAAASNLTCEWLCRTMTTVSSSLILNQLEQRAQTTLTLGHRLGVSCSNPLEDCVLA
jgi:hypothetical protein